MGNRKGRSTVYNEITSKEKLKECNPDNIQLGEDFLDYLSSIDRAPSTILQYKNNLNIFWCWNLDFNNNKFFVKLGKRDVSKFQNHAIKDWGWSPKRVRTVRSTLSSLSNYIENILDDEFEGYKPIICKIEAPANIAVREKTIFSENDLTELLDALVENKKYMKACVLALAINSGRRKAELPRFKASYFDKKNLICEGSLYQTPEKIITKGRGSRGKGLYIYTLANSFQPYLDLWMQERYKLGIESEWLFPKYKDGKWVDEQIGVPLLNGWARQFSNFLGKPFYWHSLRHYFTTRLAKSNLPDSIIQQIVGWESADMVKLYNDTTLDNELEKYFGSGGIKTVTPKKLTDL